MAEHNSEIKINIKIGGRSYPLTVKASEEEYIRKAANSINDKIREYADSFSAKDNQDLLAIVALENTTRLLQYSQSSPDVLLNQIEQKLAGLEKSLMSIS